jgi:hypothetical protein
MIGRENSWAFTVSISADQPGRIARLLLKEGSGPLAGVRPPDLAETQGRGSAARSAPPQRTLRWRSDRHGQSPAQVRRCPVLVHCGVSSDRAVSRAALPRGVPQLFRPWPASRAREATCSGPARCTSCSAACSSLMQHGLLEPRIDGVRVRVVRHGFRLHGRRCKSLLAVPLCHSTIARHFRAMHDFGFGHRIEAATSTVETPDTGDVGPRQ